MLRFNSEKSKPFSKNKRPEIVKWVEQDPLSSRVPRKFVTVFEDGVIYFYDKESCLQFPEEDYPKSMI